MKSVSKSRVASDSILLAFVRVISTIVSIATTKILSVGLGLEEYGTYSQVNVIVILATSVLLLGLGDAINYFYNNQGKEYSDKIRQDIVNTIFAIEIVIGVLVAVFMIGARSFISSYFGNDAIKDFLLIVALKPMIDNLLQLYQVLYVSSGKSRIIALRNLIISLLKLAGIYIATIILKNSYLIFGSIVLLDILQLIVMKVWFSREAFSVNPLKSKASHVKQVIQFSLPMAVYAMTSMLSRTVDKLVIGRLSDASTFAIYANCSKVLPFDIVSTSFAVVLIPFIMRYVSAKEHERATQLFNNYLKIGYYSVWTLGIAVLITANQVISFLYTDEYVAGRVVFIIYVFDSMLRFANMHLILTSAGQAKKLMKYSVMSLILNVILSVIFYKCMGIIGPAVATLVTACIYAFQVINESRRILKAKWIDVFDLKSLGRFSVSLIGVGLILSWINRIMLSYGANRYFAMFVAAGLCVVLIILLNRKDIRKTLVTMNSLK